MRTLTCIVCPIAVTQPVKTGDAVITDWWGIGFNVVIVREI